MSHARGLQFTVRVGEHPQDLFAVVGFALTEGLSAKQSDAEFDAKLAEAIDSIFEASRAG